MTNDKKFQKVFGFYATEMWAKPEKEFLEWINSEALEYEPGEDLISRADAVKRLLLFKQSRAKIVSRYDIGFEDGLSHAINILDLVPQVYIPNINIEEEPKTEEWVPCSERLPSEEGLYMVTQKTFSDDYRFIDLFHYGKPMMPNRKVKGACWYRSDSEWGDVVYDDTDIIAWMPLPKPYRADSEG